MNGNSTGSQARNLSKTALGSWHPGGKQFLLDSNNNLMLDAWGVGLVRSKNPVGRRR